MGAESRRTTGRRPDLPNSGGLAALRGSGRRPLFWAVGLASAVLVAGVAAAAWVSHTAAGREVALDWVLSRARPAINGTITVGSLGETGLLGGTTLRDVALADSSGHTVFAADSVQARYSIAGLLTGVPDIADLRLWGPVMDLALPSGQPVQLSSLVRRAGDGDAAGGGAADPGTQGPDRSGDGADDGSPVILKDVSIRDGTFVFPNALGARTEVSGIDVDLPELTLGPSPDLYFAAQTADGALVYPMGDWTLDLSGIDAEVELGPGRAAARAESFRLPGSEGSGEASIVEGDDGLTTTFDLDLSRLSLSDLGGIDPRFDHGEARGRVRIVREPSEGRIELHAMDADLGAGGSISFDGTIVPGDTTLLRSFRVESEGLAFSELEPFLGDPLGQPAWLSGEILFEREPDRFGAQGDLVAVAEETGDTLARVGGGWHALEPGRAERLSVNATLLDYELLGILAPGPEWQGVGSLSLRADGDLRTGMSVEIEGAHALAGPVAGAPARSDVTLTGSVYGDTAISVLDLNATMAPLSLETLAALFPGLDTGAGSAAAVRGARLAGPVEGSLSLRGALDELAVAADLATPAGPLLAQATINALRPAERYEVEVTSERLVLSDLVAGLPDSTIVSGRGSLSGSGASLDSLRSALTLAAGPSVVGELALDSAHLSAWVDEAGVLHVEQLLAQAGGVRVDGGGSIGAAPGAEGEGVVLAVSASSILPLRDLFMQGNLTAWDELPTIEQELLVAVDGADPDTFPRAADIRFEGSVDGRVELTGGLADLTASARLSMADIAYGRASAGNFAVDLTAAGLRTDNVELSGAARADSVEFHGRSFQAISVGGGYARGAGRVRLQADRSEDERYAVRGAMTLNEGSGRLDLDQLDVVLPERRWNLRGPARIEWTPDAVAVSDFALVRTRGGGVEIAASGRVARAGGTAHEQGAASARSDSPPAESDLTVAVAGLDLEVVGRLLQLESSPGGILSASLVASGTAADPAWETTVNIDGATYQTLRFDSLDVRGAFADRAVQTEAAAWNGERRSLHARGSMPLDLRLGPAPERLTGGGVDLALAFDSFPARLVLGGLRPLEEVDGQVSGSVDVGGTLADLEPAGSLRLADASALMAPFGIRLSSFDVAFDLAPSGLVSVTGSGASGAAGEETGEIEVSGTVALGHPADSVPLDLAFRARNFQIVDMPYMDAAVSTDSVTLTGSWDFPFIEGAVDVEGGSVFMEEFQRTAEAVDLYDPTLFTAATAAFGAEEDRADDDAATVRSPFLQNLRVFVDVNVGRGNFLRSRQMNVETTGALGLTFDRLDNQLILQGEIEVSRGTFALGPRALRITDGVFEFVGTPGFNPGLDLTAENRLRTREGQPMVITADISGTLLSPFLTLSSDAEGALSEADLLSYLVLGSPSSALAGEAGAASVGAGTNLLLGQFANEIGYHLALGLGVDYLSVSQAEQGQANAAFGASSLQVEVGRYLLDDVFLTAVYQRGFCADPTFPVSSGGVRLEMGMPRDLRLEGFLEGRCTRERYRGLGDAALALEHIWGFSFFREWGR